MTQETEVWQREEAKQDPKSSWILLTNYSPPNELQISNQCGKHDDLESKSKESNYGRGTVVAASPGRRRL